MKKIISYEELPKSDGQSVYLRMETDPALYAHLLRKGYNVINNISSASPSAIYITGRRQDYLYHNSKDYYDALNTSICNSLNENGIRKPTSVKFSFDDLLEHKYSLPFVLKNENQNGGREKFLIRTEEDYSNLIKTCECLIGRNIHILSPFGPNDPRNNLSYWNYLNENFVVQEYIPTPSMYNTTVRLLTSASEDILYASLKYNEPEKYMDDTTLLGYMLSKVFPLSTYSIVSNTLAGGRNVLIGSNNYDSFEEELLNRHHIDAQQFLNVMSSSLNLHSVFKSELGIICGFDYIYDVERNEWFLLEYHSRPMVGDYAKRNGLEYDTKEDRLVAEGRVRATALGLYLKKK